LTAPKNFAFVFLGELWREKRKVLKAKRGKDKFEVIKNLMRYAPKTTTAPASYLF
jgi:hypothetical protein